MAGGPVSALVNMALLQKLGDSLTKTDLDWNASLANVLFYCLRIPPLAVCCSSFDIRSARTPPTTSHHLTRKWLGENVPIIKEAFAALWLAVHIH